ncbi:uncharacterized protein LOC130723081 [Lotus japonicus]|uniref:uncharacterized protein LOC130723081 n=1 Tax=Lotus japonicus TaxID=34305 RepID=UPI0025911D94|nr:uncharacterized protein LOC130723081 [Lotus japonicus]XP_057429987.1 uncharacterized protein LOC130723081 [Lotus japonicus]XP_057429988.1 uncharacterized protein LOC130723081 [Lotus japonicus]XP_057429989.1 uncharacterized protein LOC130723081 [Lotus japonicus]
MEPRNFEPRHTGELFKHIDKQNEVFKEVKTSMLRAELRLKVEEGVLMRKLYEVMSAHGLAKTNYNNSITSYNTGAESYDNELSGANREQ